MRLHVEDDRCLEQILKMLKTVFLEQCSKTVYGSVITRGGEYYSLEQGSKSTTYSKLNFQMLKITEL
jgi:hypothetical protein